MEPSARKPSQIDLVELEVDLRLCHLWQEFEEIEEWGPETAAAFMRVSYAKGHSDALTELDPLSLYRDHGYKPPRAG